MMLLPVVFQSLKVELVLNFIINNMLSLLPMLNGGLCFY